MSFGDRLKQRREEKRLTQEDVAAFFGADFSRQSVSKWERGDGYPEAENLWILAISLDMSLDELFADELTYLKKKKGTEDTESHYPGLIAGLKVFAETFNRNNKSFMKGSEFHEKN